MVDSRASRRDCRRAQGPSTDAGRHAVRVPGRTPAEMRPAFACFSCTSRRSSRPAPQLSRSASPPQACTGPGSGGATAGTAVSDVTRRAHPARLLRTLQTRGDSTRCSHPASSPDRRGMSPPRRRRGWAARSASARRRCSSPARHITSFRGAGASSGPTSPRRCCVHLCSVHPSGALRAVAVQLALPELQRPVHRATRSAMVRPRGRTAGPDERAAAGEDRTRRRAAGEQIARHRRPRTQCSTARHEARRWRPRPSRPHVGPVPVSE